MSCRCLAKVLCHSDFSKSWIRQLIFESWSVTMDTVTSQYSHHLGPKCAPAQMHRTYANLLCLMYVDSVCVRTKALHALNNYSGIGENKLQYHPVHHNQMAVLIARTNQFCNPGRLHSNYRTQLEGLAWSEKCLHVPRFSRRNMAWNILNRVSSNCSTSIALDVSNTSLTVTCCTLTDMGGWPMEVVEHIA